MPALKWTEEKLWEEARKYRTRKEFSEGNYGAYQRARRLGTDFLGRLCAHMIPGVKWTDEILLKEAGRYATRKEFEQGNSGAYQACRRKGAEFMNHACYHMAQGMFGKWTDLMLEEEARKYKTRSDFIYGNNPAYKAMMRKGDVFADKICAHMNRVFQDWSLAALKEEAKKYKTRYEFCRENQAAYSAAKRRGGVKFLDNICSHMKAGIGGFKRGESGVLYQFRVVCGRKVYYKVGISNGDPIVRARHFGVKEGVYIERTHAIWFEDGAECRQMEKELHAAAKAKGLQYIGKDLMKSGYTEIFTKPLLQ